MSALDAVKVLNRVFRSDIRWRILVALSKSSPVTLRGLARMVGVTPKSLYKYVEELRAAQIIEVQVIRNSRVTLIRLSPDAEKLREFLKDLPLFALIFAAGLIYGMELFYLVKALL